MKKPVLRGRVEDEMHQSESSSNIDHNPRNNPASPPGTPAWVKMILVLFFILVVLFLILHLTGNGFGDHLKMSTIEHLVQQL